MCSFIKDYTQSGLCLVYNTSGCQYPDWPPLCPFQLVDLLPCPIWTCLGEAPKSFIPDYNNTGAGIDDETGALFVGILFAVLLAVLLCFVLALIGFLVLKIGLFKSCLPLLPVVSPQRDVELELVQPSGDRSVPRVRPPRSRPVCPISSGDGAAPQVNQVGHVNSCQLSQQDVLFPLRAEKWYSSVLHLQPPTPPTRTSSLPTSRSNII